MMGWEEMNGWIKVSGKSFGVSRTCLTTLVYGGDGIEYLRVEPNSNVGYGITVDSLQT